MKIITEDKAKLIYEWATTRDGIAEWHSHDLGNPGANSLTPWTTKEGLPADQSDPPHWRYVKGGCTRYELKDIAVGIDKEFKRFHIALTRSGLSVNLTRGSTVKLNRALEVAGPNSRYEFDYEKQEAVIFQCVKVVPLEEYMKGKV